MDLISQVQTQELECREVDPLAFGRLRGRSRVNGDEWVEEFEQATRTATLTTPEGRQGHAVLDEAGRVAEVQWGGQIATTVTYDDLGRPERCRAATGSSR